MRSCYKINNKDNAKSCMCRKSPNISNLFIVFHFDAQKVTEIVF